MQYSTNSEIREKIYRFIFLFSILLCSAILLFFFFFFKDAILTNFGLCFLIYL